MKVESLEGKLIWLVPTMVTHVTTAFNGVVQIHLISGITIDVINDMKDVALRINSYLK